MLELKDELVCLDDPKQVKLKGQFERDEGTFLRIEFKRCNSTNDEGITCKTDEEISEWI